MSRTAVTVLAAALAAAVACDRGVAGDHPKHEDKAEKAAKHKFKLGRIDNKDIDESSGLAASRRHPGVFWTHNDSGNGPYVFAITKTGHCLASFQVAGVRNTDWECIAIDGEGHLYIGDTGNNDHKRDRIFVYRVDEPDPTAAGPGGKGQPLRVNQVWRLKYPDKPFDAESLVIYQGKGYVISKLLNGKNAGLYRFDLSANAGGEGVTLEHVCDLPIRSPATDACISDDGKQLAVMTVTGPNLFQIDGDMTNVAKVQPAYVNYFDAGDMNMEGVCFTEEGLLASTEQGQMLLFGYELFAKQGEKKH
jgi:hypothetical protein